MSIKTSAGLIALALCFSCTSAHAQFKFSGKLGSGSKQAGSHVSRSAKSFNNTLRSGSSVKKINSARTKLPTTLPIRGIGTQKSTVTLPKRGISLPKSVTLPKLGKGSSKIKPITITKPRMPFPNPVGGIKKPLPIQLPNPLPGFQPKPGVVQPKPGIVPPNPGVTPLPEPIKHPHPAGCWKPPHHCHWWTKICTPIQTCRPADVVHCHWNVVHCDTVIGGHVVDTRWYLGIEGVFLPGKGLGVENVAEGSPAAAVGLTAGMVIVQANGIAMETEDAMQQAIANSQGILQIVVISEANAQPLQGTIQMVRVASAKF